MFKVFKVFKVFQAITKYALLTVACGASYISSVHAGSTMWAFSANVTPFNVVVQNRGVTVQPIIQRHVTVPITLQAPIVQNYVYAQKYCHDHPGYRDYCHYHDGREREHHHHRGYGRDHRYGHNAYYDNDDEFNNRQQVYRSSTYTTYIDYDYDYGNNNNNNNNNSYGYNSYNGYNSYTYPASYR